MEWMEWAKFILNVLLLPILAGVAKMLASVNELIKHQAIQDEKMNTMKASLTEFKDEFHTHQRDDVSGFGSVQLRINGLAENLAGVLATIGIMPRKSE